MESKDQVPVHGPAQTEDLRVFEGRRSFFLWLLGVGGAAMATLLSAPVLRYVFYPVYAKTTSISWSDLGSKSLFASLKTPVRQVVNIEQVDGWREADTKKPVYITEGKREESLDGVEVLSTVCPHLGCEVPWNEAQGKFVCPCHGSVFDRDGSLEQGPATRGLDTLPVKVENDHLMARYEYFQALLPYKKKVE